MKYILALIVVASIVGCDSKSLHSQVALDYVRSGNMALNAGDYMTACVHYGIAKQAALSSKDEGNYKTILDIERKTCKIAGING